MNKIKILLPLASMLLKQGRNELSMKRVQENESVLLDKLY